MTLDDVLAALRTIPRPQLSPFFAPRVTARATRNPRRTPLVMKLYWLAVAFAAAPLTGSWIGVAAIAITGGLFAFATD